MRRRTLGVVNHHESLPVRRNSIGLRDVFGESSGLADATQLAHTVLESGSSLD